MSLRTTRRSVTFRSPFSLRGLDGVQPAGAYIVETDEERLDHLSVAAWRRVSTAFVLPLSNSGSSYQMFKVDPADLEAAERRDALAELGA